MPLRIIIGDITTQHVDAIVNAANTSLRGGGGVGGCPTGSARITRETDFPPATSSTPWGRVGAEAVTGSARLFSPATRGPWIWPMRPTASQWPFLSSRPAYGYPREQAIAVAVETISAFLVDHSDMTVFIVCWSRENWELRARRYPDLAQ